MGTWPRASSACAYRASCTVYRTWCIASRPALHVLRALSPGRLTTALTGLHGPAAAQVPLTHAPSPLCPSGNFSHSREHRPFHHHSPRLAPQQPLASSLGLWPCNAHSLGGVGVPITSTTMSQCADPNCNAASCLSVPEPNPAQLRQPSSARPG
jgi:hypothetical protein